MEPEQPLGQPVTPNPTDPQFAPQPLGSEPPKPSMGKKKLWLIIAGVVGLIVVLGAAYWFMAKSANESYKKDAVAYKQAIKDVRDGMDKKLEDEGLSAYDREAPPIFEEYGKKMQDITADAPKQPKVFLIIPAGDNDTKKQIGDLTTAANGYAGELRHIYDLFTYYNTVTDAFKPVKDLGTISVFSTSKVAEAPDTWAAFMEKLKASTPPSSLESLKVDLIAQGEVMQIKFTELANGFDSRSLTENDAMMGELGDLSDTFSQTFIKSANDSTEKIIGEANDFYKKLDEKLN